MNTNCPGIELLSAWADDELSREHRVAIDAHLACCERCRTWLDELRIAQTSLRALADDSLGFDLSQVVRGRIDSLPRPAGAARARGRHGWRWFVPAGLGAPIYAKLDAELAAHPLPFANPGIGHTPRGRDWLECNHASNNWPKGYSENA